MYMYAEAIDKALPIGTEQITYNPAGKRLDVKL